jgi:hypothetical protein
MAESRYAEEGRAERNLEEVDDRVFLCSAGSGVKGSEALEVKEEGEGSWSLVAMEWEATARVVWSVRRRRWKSTVQLGPSTHKEANCKVHQQESWKRINSY